MKCYNLVLISKSVLCGLLIELGRLPIKIVKSKRCISNPFDDKDRILYRSVICKTNYANSGAVSTDHALAELDIESIIDYFVK